MHNRRVPPVQYKKLNLFPEPRFPLSLSRGKGIRIIERGEDEGKFGRARFRKFFHLTLLPKYFCLRQELCNSQSSNFRGCLEKGGRNCVRTITAVSKGIHCGGLFLRLLQLEGLQFAEEGGREREREREATNCLAVETVIHPQE